MKKNVLFLNILFLFFFNCPADGPENWFYIYNNTLENINVEAKPISLKVKSFTILPGQNSSQNDESLIGGFGAKKYKPSEYIEYIKITKQDDTILYNLEGNDLDTTFKIDSETDSFILYRLDVN